MKTRTDTRPKSKRSLFSKRGVSFLLVLVMLLSILPYAALAEGEAGGQITLRIEYIRKDASGNEILVARTYEAPYEDGEAYNVASPTIAGYSPDQASISGTMNSEDSRIANGVLAFTVEYAADQASYQVIYRMQNLNGGYDAEAPITLTGATGSRTNAQAKAVTPEGFTLVPFEQATIAASGTKVYINYDRNTQFVRYETNGGGYIASEEYMFGKLVPLDKTPQKAGYAFGGWFSDAALQNEVTSITIGTEDVTVYAKWITPGQTTYKVLYMTESATVAGAYDVFGSKTIDATAGSSISYNAGIHNPGFTGSDAAGFSFEKADAEVTVAGDGSTVYRVYFKRNTFSIELQKKRGWPSTSYDYYKTITAKYGTNVQAQWFEGDTQNYRWYTEKGGNVYYKDMTVMPAENITLYGRSESGWKDCILYYQVEKVDGNGYDTHHTVNQKRWILFGGNPSITVEEDCYEIPGFTYVRYTDFEYNGFLLWGDYEGYIYYSRNTYTINFDTRGGAPATIAPITAKYGATLRTVANPTKEGYTFTGWYTDSSGEGTPVDITTMPALPSASTTLHAGWKKNEYTVKFNLNGAEGSIADAKVLYKDTVSAPDAPTRQGYEFKGWYTTQTCDAGSRYDFSRPVTSDMELFARFEGFESVNYTVEHIKYDSQNNPSAYAEPQLFSANIGSTVTAYSVYKSELASYVADAPSKSLVLTGGTNTIVFEYREYSDIAYTIIPTFDGVAIEGVTPTTGTTNQSRLFFTPAAVAGYVAKNTRVAFDLSPTEANTFYVAYYKALDASLIEVNSEEIAYKGAAPSFSTNAWPFSEVSEDDFVVDIACGYTQGDDAGTYPITASITPDIFGEYIFINQPTAGELTVKKGTIPEEGDDIAFAVKATDSKEYDSAYLYPTITKQVGIAKIEYSIDGVSYSETPIGVKNVAEGTKTVYVKATPTDAVNYEPVVKTVALWVTQKTLSVTVDDINLEVGDAKPVLAVKEITGYVSGEEGKATADKLTVNAALSTTYVQGAPSATYPIQLLSEVSLGNYKVVANNNLASIYVALKIIPEEGNLAFGVSANSVTYNGNYHTVNVVNKNAYTLEYSVTNSGTDWAPYAPATHGIVNVAQSGQVVYVRASKEGYAPKVLSAVVTVRPVVLTADVQNIVLIYGDTLGAFTVTDINGYVGNEKDTFLANHKTALASALSTDYTNTSPVVGSPYDIELESELVVGNYVFEAGVLANITVDGLTIPEEGENGFSVEDNLNNAYDATAKGIVIHNEGGYALQFSANGVDGWSNEEPKQTNVGTQTVYVKASKENYQDKIVSAAVSVVPKTLTLDVADITLTYGDAVPVFSAASINDIIGYVDGEKAALIDGHKAVFAAQLSTNYTQFSAVAGSPYDISVAAITNGNYTLYAGTVAQIAVTGLEIPEEGPEAFGVSGGIYNYDGTARGVEVVNDGNYDIAYSATGVDGSWQAAPLIYTNAGTETIFVKASKENYADKVLSAEVVIHKVGLTVTVNNYAGTVTAGSAVPSFAGLGYTASGFVNNEDESVINGTPAYSTNYTASSPAGTYAIAVSGLTAENYDIEIVPGTLVVAAAVVDPGPSPSPVESPSPSPVVSPSAAAPAATTTTTGGAGTTTTPESPTPSPSESVTTSPNPSPVASPVTTQVTEPDTPLSDAPVVADSKDSWALLTVVFAVATVLVMALLLIGFISKKAMANMGKGVLRVLSILPALAAILITVLTQNFGGNMVVADMYTWLNAALLVAEGVLGWFASRSKSTNERSA